MGFELFKCFRDGPEITPKLEVQEISLTALGPFSQIRGSVMRDGKLPPHRWGDSIVETDRAICVVDASAPRVELLGFNEANLVRDLTGELPNIFDGSPLDPTKLIEALSWVLTSEECRRWKSRADIGLSLGGIYCDNYGAITVFNIGTGFVCINNKIKLSPKKEFYHPDPRRGSNVAKCLELDTFLIRPVRDNSIIICTDGIDPKHFTQNSAVKGAKEATIVRLER